MTTRREFIERTVLSTVGAAVIAPRERVALHSDMRAPAGFVDLLRPPDLVEGQAETATVRLARTGGDRWSGDDILVTTASRNGALNLSLAAPKSAIKRLHLRWRGNLADTRLMLGDAWERGYGDLEWRSWAPDRVMPWYAATLVGSRTHAYGVRTGARGFCFWQIDPQGVSLWIDVRSGGAALQRAMGVRGD